MNALEIGRAALAKARGAAPAEPLALRKDGTPKKTLANVMTVFSSDPAWRGVVAYDAFAEGLVIARKPPHRPQDAVDVALGSPWTSQDSTRAAAWLDQELGLSVPSALVTEALMAVAQRNVVHPVRAWLDGLAWDLQPRVLEFFSRYCGVRPSVYAEGVARMLFVSTVARVRRPGCKVDTIPVFEGRQGIGKSRLLRVLGGAWFADTPLNLADKDAYQALRGVLVYELAELASFKGRDATRIKSFASSQVDTYRPSYEARARSVPRQCVFVGTTNEETYLADATGARRFWPVRLEKIDLRAVMRDRDQLFAEADVLFRSGTSWWPDASLDALGADEQAERFEGDPWDETIAAWLERPRKARPLSGGGVDEEALDPSDGFTMAEILSYAVGMPDDRQAKREQNRAAEILHRLGWSRGPRRREGELTVRRWIRGGGRGVVTGVVA
jgi:putative DNA primase/helicase